MKKLFLIGLLALLLLAPTDVEACRAACIAAYNACADVNGALDEGCIAGWTACMNS